MNHRWNYQSRTAMQAYLAARQRLFHAGHYYLESDYYTTEEPEEEAEEYAGPSDAELLASAAELLAALPPLSPPPSLPAPVPPPPKPPPHNPLGSQVLGNRDSSPTVHHRSDSRTVNPEPPPDRRLEPRVGYFNPELYPEYLDPELGPNWKRVVPALDRRLRQQVLRNYEDAFQYQVMDQAARYCKNIVNRIFPERTRISEMEILSGELELDQRKRMRRKKLPA